MHRRLTFLLAMMTSLSACAQPAAPTVAAGAAGSAVAVPVAASPAAEAAIRTTIKKVAPDMEVTSIRPAPFAGFSEVAVQGRVLYISNDGKLLLNGTLLDIQNNRNLTAASEGVLRKAQLDSIGSEGRIIFAAAQPKHRVTVFTDVECGFCRKLHEQIADYNKAGITVEYLFFPRMGPGSEGFEQAIAVACASDPRAALTRAKGGARLPHARCENSVAADYALGQRVGVDGTPAIYAESGVQIGGYLPPAEMLAKLDDLKAPGSP